ncbi:MAG: GyrI-like domain-containing protein [Thermodesulfobacteriota bacterium]|nr:GyrI-like domain-containing protein [Thermodesulfobacteriota bacterium]
MYSVEVASLEEKKVVALVLRTSFVENRQAEEIPPFFHRVMEENTLETIPNRINSNQICAVRTIEDSPQFDYYMGVEVSTFDDIPAEMKTLTLPAGRYAVTSFVKRGNADVLQAFKYITEKWLPEKGYTQDHGSPVFIYYDERFIPVYRKEGYDGNPVAEIFVPVRD